MTPNELKQLAEVTKEFSKGDFEVLAAIDKIKNNGQWLPVIYVSVVHVPTKKHTKGVYRGNPSEFRNWLKREYDSLEAQIIAEISVKPTDNSL